MPLPQGRPHSLSFSLADEPAKLGDLNLVLRFSTRARIDGGTMSQGIQRRWRRRLGLAVVALLLTWAMVTGYRLLMAAQTPAEATLVLGGSIRREMYAAEQVLPRPLLISHGSPDPCIRILFERAGADLDQVWLEKCAESTFENLVYSLPLLQAWGKHHVRLITSPGHAPRAYAMARILFGSHGIWTTLEQVEEQGIPGNQESWLKTGLDVTRSALWAIVSQGYDRRCRQVIPLASVDLVAWQARGFKCEHQAGIN